MNLKSLTKPAALPAMGDALRSASQSPPLADNSTLALRDVFFSDACRREKRIEVYSRLRARTLRGFVYCLVFLITNFRYKK